MAVGAGSMFDFFGILDPPLPVAKAPIWLTAEVASEEDYWLLEDDVNPDSVWVLPDDGSATG